MAIGTVASRITGFLRTATLVVVLGVSGVRQAFEVSNTLPNSLYDLLRRIPGTNSRVSLRSKQPSRQRRQRKVDRAIRNPRSSIWKVGWLRRRTEARQLQCSSDHPPPRSTRYVP
jgi:hypothetical protein